MRNKIVPHIKIFIILLFYFQNLYSEENWQSAQEGDKIILIRHALAPGSGDPEGFNL